jgi:hypothetical protein
MKKEEFEIGTYSKADMAGFYGVSVTTFLEWINVDAIMSRLLQTGYQRTQKVLKPKQVQIIVEHLGEP